MIGFSLLFSCLFVGVGNRVYDFHAPMTERVSVAEKTYYFGNVRSSGWTELTLRREDGTKETLTDSAGLFCGRDGRYCDFGNAYGIVRNRVLYGEIIMKCQ